MNKIAHISVRGNREIDFTKKPEVFAFFNILTTNVYLLWDFIFPQGFLS